MARRLLRRDGVQQRGHLGAVGHVGRRHGAREGQLGLGVDGEVELVPEPPARPTLGAEPALAPAGIRVGGEGPIALRPGVDRGGIDGDLLPQLGRPPAQPGHGALEQGGDQVVRRGQPGDQPPEGVLGGDPGGRGDPDQEPQAAVPQEFPPQLGDGMQVVDPAGDQRLEEDPGACLAAPRPVPALAQAAAEGIQVQSAQHQDQLVADVTEPEGLERESGGCMVYMGRASTCARWSLIHCHSRANGVGGPAIRRAVGGNRSGGRSMSNAITAMQGLTTDEAPTKDLTPNALR